MAAGLYTINRRCVKHVKSCQLRTHKIIPAVSNSPAAQVNSTTDVVEATVSLALTLTPAAGRTRPPLTLALSNSPASQMNLFINVFAAVSAVRTNLNFSCLEFTRFACEFDH